MNFENIFFCTTDTVNGIGGPVCQETLDALFYLKNRPLEKKIMILVGSLKQAQEFKQWNQKATEVALKYWPGNYSIIINDQGFRMPNNKLLLDFLLKNGPMYVTSANLSGQKPIELSQANDIFPKIKQVYDFGKGSNVPSTIINLDTNETIKRK
ncbi:L-threonylcarbamoyladenylate synthase [Mycoplasmopsis hyopharyngis]|uniref:L-threonylcarbamoyladenylate synthase n=1 Tax=Mycoplasmopsis hyopharyngis TaxID=29558 RepID=UPI0038737D49